MSGMLNKYLEKGKSKLKEFSGSQSQPQSHTQPQGYPAQGYPGQGYAGQQYHQSYCQPSYPQPSYNAPPPNQYQQPYPYSGPPPPQNQQWGPPPGPPPNNWGPPPNQWGSPPPPQQPFSPPIPQNSKPQSQPPPIPGNRPSPQPPQASPASSQLRPYWQPSFDSSTPVSQNFRHELGDHGWGNNEKQNYTDSPANSFHYDNRLIVRGLVQNGSYTSARLNTHQTLSRAKGYVTVTALAPVAEGIWPAFWMLPQDPFKWPTDGEVDILESWNGECTNHSCLHWGAYNGEDWNKHRVAQTKIPDLASQPHTFGFAWIEEEGIPDWRGRMIWYVDGRPVMKGNIPQGTRRMEDFRILINVAMGGTVNKGNLPKDGHYDFVISDLKMCEEPLGGWGEFERAWSQTPEGKTM